jgi:alkyl sulfatase BDS1-like metallo-beta-lactamase superfamily hydrolase
MQVRRSHPLALALLTGCWLACGPEAPPDAAPVDFEGAAHPELVAHSAEFARKVYEVAPGLHVAVGFGLANSILIEGDDGVVIVDVMESVEAAREVLAAFREITDKPIRALVYTHNHADHVFGARGFVPEGDLPVYAHASTNTYIDRVVSIIRPAIANRSARMFGTYLPNDENGVVNAGIGPRLRVGHGGGTPSLIRPNHTFEDRLDVTIAGIDMHMEHAPGETNDQIFVWLPRMKALLSGDNVYKAFPNLYTIRGTLYRDVLGWVKSIDRMRELEPDYLVPSHTRPVAGREKIGGILTAYRDAIQFVHDQTIRGLNRGLTPDELVQVVKLPPHLRDHPYLRELYGTVEWSVRMIYDGYLGWFDGDTATLSPAPPDERAAGYVALAGGPEAMRRAVREALDAERWRWAAELASHLVRAEPENAENRQLEARALRELGRLSISPNGRNYYLTQALELEGEVTVDEDPRANPSSLDVAMAIPIANFMESLPVNLDAQAAADTDLAVGFRFTDEDREFGVHVRRGVAELMPRLPEAPAAVLTTTGKVWKEILVGQRNAALAFAGSDVQIDGSTLDLLRFLSLFQP